MAKNSNQTRYGIFYRSHDKWTGPYAGKTFTKYALSRQPVAGDVKYLKNNVLKTRIQLRPVKA